MFEQQIRFIVRAEIVSQVRNAIESLSGQCDEVVLSARYFDTPDSWLASHGASLRLRREAGQWIQSWALSTGDGLTHIEHNLPIGNGSPHLAGLVGRAGVEQLMPTQRDAKRLQRRMRSRYQFVYERLRSVVNHATVVGDCVVSVSLDAGEIRARRGRHPVLELSFHLITGDLSAMIDLATQWQRAHGLVWYPPGMGSVGDRLAARRPLIAHRQDRRILFRSDCQVSDAARLIFDECLGQVAYNAAAISIGEASRDHLRLCRRGLRRLAVANQFFAGWIDLPPAALQQDLHRLVRTLQGRPPNGPLREALLAQLYADGCGPLGYPLNATGRQPVVRLDGELQELMMGLLAWRHKPFSGRRIDAAYRTLMSRRLHKRLRRIQKRARRFDAASTDHIKKLRRQIRGLSICVGFSRSLLSKKQFRRLKRVVFISLPMLEQWHRLEKAAGLLRLAAPLTHPSSAAERASLQFAAGWLSGRMTGLRISLAPLMRRIASLRIRL